MVKIMYENSASTDFSMWCLERTWRRPYEVYYYVNKEGN